ncbi:MAG: YraN family protein [bacterium]
MTFSFLNPLPLTKDPKALGKLGEKLAGRLLKKSGYKILQKNYRCPLGEIDLIAYQGDCLVFVEVKTRSGYAYGGPLAALTKKKRARVVRSAQFYLKQKRLSGVNYRFDVVSIVKEDRRKPQIEHIRNAFGG